MGGGTLAVDRGGQVPVGTVQALWLQVHSFDAPGGLTLACDYNGANASDPLRGAYLPTPTVTTQPGLADRHMRLVGADLRLNALPSVAVDRSVLSRQALP